MGDDIIERDVYNVVNKYHSKQRGYGGDIKKMYSVLQGDMYNFCKLEKMNEERGNLHTGQMMVAVEQPNGYIGAHIPKRRWNQVIRIHKTDEKWNTTEVMDITNKKFEAYLYQLRKPQTHFVYGRKHERYVKSIESYEIWQKTKIPYEYCWLRHGRQKISASTWTSLVNQFGIDWRSHPIAKRNTIHSVYDVFGKHISIARIMHEGNYILRLYQCRQTAQTVVYYITYDPRSPDEWIFFTGGRYKDVPELIRWRAYGTPPFEEFLRLDDAMFTDFVLSHWRYTESLSLDEQYKYFNSPYASRWIETLFEVKIKPGIHRPINLYKLHNNGI